MVTLSRQLRRERHSVAASCTWCRLFGIGLNLFRAQAALRYSQVRCLRICALRILALPEECGSRPPQTASRAREDRGIFGRPRGGWRRACSTIGRRGASRPTRSSSNAPSRRPCTSSPEVSSGRLSSSPPCDTVGVKSGTQNATWWADPSCAWMLLGHAVTGLAHAGVLPRNTLEGAPTSSVGDRGTTLGPVA